MRQIHTAVEQNRGDTIPDWAYRDVLFMLIHYSIAAYELLEKKLTEDEKEEVFNVFYRMGLRMGLTGLPANYTEWIYMRAQHLNENLINSRFTTDLYQQYKKHLGFARYQLLKQVQMTLVPAVVNRQLGLGKASWLVPLLYFYKLSRSFKLDAMIRNMILPPEYKAQVQQLNIA